MGQKYTNIDNLENTKIFTYIILRNYQNMNARYVANLIKYKLLLEERGSRLCSSQTLK